MQTRFQTVKNNIDYNLHAKEYSNEFQKLSISNVLYNVISSNFLKMTNVVIV